MKVLFLVIAALGASALPAWSQGRPSYAFPPDAEQMTIVGLPEFRAHLPDSDGFTLWLSSGRSGNPTASTFRLWGLTITDDAAVRRLLEDRVVRCLPVLEYQTTAYVDCDAAPEPGREWVHRGTGGAWINLLTWLPQLGYAEPHCGEPELSAADNTQVGSGTGVITMGEVGYFCREGQPRREWTIVETGEPSGPALLPADHLPLIAAIQECWNTEALSAEAARTTVTVAFELGRDARLVRDVVLVAAEGGDGENAAASAFEAARRAILRCQGEGFPLLANAYDRWRLVELTFDPLSGTIQGHGSQSAIGPQARPEGD